MLKNALICASTFCARGSQNQAASLAKRSGTRPGRILLLARDIGAFNLAIGQARLARAVTTGKSEIHNRVFDVE